MPRKTASKNIIDLRRERVSRLILRGFTQREIAVALSEDENYRVLNPSSGKAFSLGTINGDIKALKESWQRGAMRTYEDYLAENLAKLDELERTAWAQNELNIVLSVIDKRAKLLGLDAPQRIQVLDKWHEEVLRLILEGSISFTLLEQELGYRQARQMFIEAGVEPDNALENSVVVEYTDDTYQQALAARYKAGEVTELELEKILGDGELVRRIIES